MLPQLRAGCVSRMTSLHDAVQVQRCSADMCYVPWHDQNYICTGPLDLHPLPAHDALTSTHASVGAGLSASVRLPSKELYAACRAGAGGAARARRGTVSIRSGG